MWLPNEVLNYIFPSPCPPITATEGCLQRACRAHAWGRAPCTPLPQPGGVRTPALLPPFQALLASVVGSSLGSSWSLCRAWAFQWGSVGTRASAAAESRLLPPEPGGSQQGAGGLDKPKGSALYCRVGVLERKRDSCGWAQLGAAWVWTRLVAAWNSSACSGALHPVLRATLEHPQTCPFPQSLLTRVRWLCTDLGTNKPPGQRGPTHASQPLSPWLRAVPGYGSAAWGAALIPCRCPLSKRRCR